MCLRRPLTTPQPRAGAWHESRRSKELSKAARAPSLTPDAPQRKSRPAGRTGPSDAAARAQLDLRKRKRARPAQNRSRADPPRKSSPGQDGQAARLLLLRHGRGPLLLWPGPPHEAPPHQDGPPSYSVHWFISQIRRLPAPSSGTSRNDALPLRRLRQVPLQSEPGIHEALPPADGAVQRRRVHGLPRACAASRSVVVFSLHSNDSCPSHDAGGGLFFEFERDITHRSTRGSSNFNKLQVERRSTVRSS